MTLLALLVLVFFAGTFISFALSGLAYLSYRLYLLVHAKSVDPARVLALAPVFWRLRQEVSTNPSTTPGTRLALVPGLVLLASIVFVLSFFSVRLTQGASLLVLDARRRSFWERFYSDEARGRRKRMRQHGALFDGPALGGDLPDLRTLMVEFPLVLERTLEFTKETGQTEQAWAVLANAWSDFYKILEKSRPIRFREGNQLVFIHRYLPGHATLDVVKRAVLAFLRAVDPTDEAIRLSIGLEDTSIRAQRSIISELRKISARLCRLPQPPDQLSYTSYLWYDGTSEKEHGEFIREFLREADLLSKWLEALGTDREPITLDELQKRQARS